MQTAGRRVHSPRHDVGAPSRGRAREAASVTAHDTGERQAVAEVVAAFMAARASVNAAAAVRGAAAACSQRGVESGDASLDRVGRHPQWRHYR